MFTVEIFGLTSASGGAYGYFHWKDIDAGRCDAPFSGGAETDRARPV
jgi:hypothetical protein